MLLCVPLHVILGQPSSSSLESDPIPSKTILSLQLIVLFFLLVNLQVPCVDKIALLIGNREYREMEMPKLRTPEMDTHDLAGALFSIGFKVIPALPQIVTEYPFHYIQVVSLVNLTKAEMDQALLFFLSLLGANVYALFFFAGEHLLQHKYSMI